MTSIFPYATIQMKMLFERIGEFADCSGIWQRLKDDVTAPRCRGERRETHVPFALT